MYIVKANDEIFEVNDSVFLEALVKVNPKDKFLVINDPEKEIGEIEITQIYIFGISIRRSGSEDFNQFGKKRLALFGGAYGVVIDSTKFQTNQAEVAISMPDNTMLLECIRNLSSLETLFFIGEGITTISEIIGDLCNLKSLMLFGTETTILPENIGALTGLKELNLDSTEITTLPESIVNLTKLEKLSLTRTKITTLPENIGALTGLKELNLDDTEITTLPESIVNLTELEKLSLTRTKITTLPDNIGDLTSLKNLSLKNTEITTLPESIGNLISLTILDISDTGITSLTENIVKLTGLNQLYLNNLHLDTIPRSCVRDDLYLSLDNTILSRQPKALFNLSNDQILTLYYDQERIPIREGKVIFLGESGVGKSHTIKRIMNYGKDEDYDLESTPGIDINRFSCKDKAKTKILFWDFGGQEIMQSMHQCFLTERTCYVVVVSNRDSQKAMTQARKWLRTVAGFSSQVSVILAVNQWNNVSEEQNIDKDELLQLCPKLSEIIFYTAKGGEADVFNEKLTNTIINEVQKLDSVQLELPKSWADIRESLMNSSQNYISLDEYRRICATYGLDNEDEATEEIRTWLLEWFNDMGVCFSYHKNAPMTEPELKNYKVLSPKWLTNGIYRIINNGIRFADQGCLTLSEVNMLLNDPDLISVDKSLTYKKDEEQLYVLEVMRKFSRSFALKDGREYIPELLQGKRPSAIRPVNYTDSVLYTMKLTYLPKSLIHRLMIDLREWNDGVQWRHGVRLCDAETALLIESQDENGKLTIELFSQNYDKFNYLFHRTRLMIMGYIENMSLVLEEEQLSRNFNGFTAKQELYSLIWDYVDDREAKISASTNTTGRRPVKVLIREMLLMLFTNNVCNTAALISDTNQCDLSPALNAVTAVYPYDTNETWADVIREENWINLINNAVDLTKRYDFGLRLAMLSTIALRDRSFLNWLFEKGTLKKGKEKMSDHNLEEKMLGGINEQIYRWAKTSPIYRKAVGAPDWDELAKALGPEQETRCTASITLLNVIWHMHPELGLMPDYESLSKKEYGRAFYSKYRDHMTHMLKTYLLGLYLYENQEDLKMQLPEEVFFPTWTITALWHDIGYLIETEDGKKDGKDAKEAFKIITDSLSLPLCHLYPSEFKKDWETVKQDVKNNHPPQLKAFQPLREKLSLFSGYGKTVSLTERDDINPIELYLSEKAEIIVPRSYYDHGIVSAMMLLYMWDALQEYMEKAYKYTNDDKKQNVMNDFRTKTSDYGEIVKQAATAVALHNLQKEENLNLSYQHVTLSDFCIPLSKEPYAWLLRVCDEMQCWDRQRFNSPTENKKPSLDGKSLFFEDGLLVIKDDESYKKLHDALEGVVDPFPSFLK